MSNTDDDNIQKISRMLEIGGTMLAQHCGTCGAPLFRYQGRVMCPVCEDVRDPRAGMQPSAAPTPSSSLEPKISTANEKKRPVAASQHSSPAPTSPAPAKALDSAAVHVSLSETESLLVRKMTLIAYEMQDETDPRRIAEYLDIIDRFVDIISKMRS